MFTSDFPVSYTERDYDDAQDLLGEIDDFTDAVVDWINQYSQGREDFINSVKILYHQKMPSSLIAPDKLLEDVGSIYDTSEGWRTALVQEVDEAIRSFFASEIEKAESIMSNYNPNAEHRFSHFEYGLRADGRLV